MRLRPAGPGDEAAVAFLLEEMGGHDGASQHPGTGPAFRAALTLPTVRAVVAEQSDGTVVGYAEMHARPLPIRSRTEGWLASLVVTPSCRNLGVGRLLVEEMRVQAVMLGCESLVVESSEWRTDAHRFYRRAGFDQIRSAARFELCLRTAADELEGLIDRFLVAAAGAATEVGSSLAGLAGSSPIAVGADGAPTEAADRAAELAALGWLEPLGLTIVSEEAGVLAAPAAQGNGHRALSEPWISLDPLDGSRNFRAGLPPWAVSIGLVEGGRPIAGLVADLASGRRWWAARGRGAWVDGRVASARPGGILALPSPTGGDRVPALPERYTRLRISGSTAVDLCRVADGTVSAFCGLWRGVVHNHDLAAAMSVLGEAGAVVVNAEGAEPLLAPDPTTIHRVVAAATVQEATELVRVQANR